MIEASGIVRAVDGERVLVEVQRRSACGGCASQSHCGTSTLGRWLSQGVSRLSVRSTLPVRAGDAVVIGLEEAALLRASLVLYLLPILGLLGGTFGGVALGGAASDGPAVAGGLLGFAAGLWLSRWRAGTRPAGADAGVILLRQADETPTVPLDPARSGLRQTGARDD